MKEIISLIHITRKNTKEDEHVSRRRFGLPDRLAILRSGLSRLVPQETKSVGEPLYLDESALTVPSLGLHRICLELARLGDWF